MEKYHGRKTPRDDEYIEAYLKTHSQIKAAALCGVGRTTIARAVARAGIPMDGRKFNVGCKKITDDQILEDISSGLTRQQIADKRGVHVENLAKRMRRLGVHARHAEVPQREKIFGSCWHYVPSHAEKLKGNPDFIYLESRNISYEQIRIKCKHCGNIIIRSDMKRNWRCDCYQERRQSEQGLQKKRADFLRLLIAVKELKTPKECVCCGEVFNSPYQSAIYCSDKCKRKAKRARYKERNPEKYRARTKRYKAGHHISRAKKYGCRYEYGITLAKVISKDKNVCQICGKLCDKNSKEWGNAGRLYPSIDHIIPLSKGGTHTWDNVQLAHLICNSYKRDNTVKREEVRT